MKQRWSKKKIIDTCLVTDFVANGSFKSLKENVNYNYDKDFAILLRTTDFTNNFNKPLVYVNEASYNFLKKSSILPDDIVICNVGSVGLTFLAPNFEQPMTIGPNSILIRPLMEGELKKKFFYYLFLSPIGQSLIESITTGTTQYKFNKTNFRQLEISFPPIDEQNRIIAKLDQCFDAIDKARTNVERNLQNANDLFQSKLNEIFSQKGEGWVEKSLNEIGEIQTGTTPSTKDKSNYGSYIPFVKPAHFNPDGSIDAGDCMLSEDGLKKGRLFPSNSILMVCIGATIGKTGYTETPVSSNQQINCLTPNKDYSPKLFYYGLICPFVQKQVAEIGRSAQATLPIINKSKWQELRVNIPIKKSVQDLIVMQLDALKSQTQSLESHYYKELGELDELKKSILQKAFEGELT